MIHQEAVLLECFHDFGKSCGLVVCEHDTGFNIMSFKPKT